jgi:(p)ppGpp synthase/HD superfamily hydrolase
MSENYVTNTQIKKAMEYAQKAHMAQVYSDCYPYFKHLEDVYKVLLRFGFDPGNSDDCEVLVSAWLHDIMEDTARSYSDIRAHFGCEAAEIVYCITDELGRHRKEKKEKTYPKLRSNPKSVILKVADRIANIEFGLQNGSDFPEMYLKEHEEFQKNLRIYRHIDEMWDYLNSLIEQIRQKVNEKK